ncbi:MAG: 50S ribosomal protein L4 [Gammaproteobacteria bacterium]|jgi:large subunit ribosomal protein L4|nr:50S ribosomal protein L4 [Gammaproteobacteria bacterium]MDA9068041.1 50S ribosomal protein L4 [Gammaproteobacteria bacterium]MDA9955319.1 50S ribosomal protein L4 [Gammaproteobacteria bacterium]MDB4253237.1 50S ribosomal protein L4 [Gammaproteobacteria bacterium]MDB9770553.1 50S ribosomal protein L4 [Gammaproteobacteria bacterium]|tara:strand:- start:3355 stop:3966 length:612 start_codon:yes stop_codon:yes gene_type:complete
MKLDVLNTANKKEDVQISDTTFGKDFNETLVHQAVVTYLAGSRQGSHKQKTRSEVRGGGKKPYAQKGTGRARAGTIRSPIWRGGGVTFAATPRDYSKKINKKMYRAAISSIFSELHRQDRLIAIEQPKLESPKTKEMCAFLKAFNLEKVLIILDEMDTNLYLSSRNIPHVEVVTVKEINPVILLRSEKVAVTPAAFKLIEAWV